MKETKIKEMKMMMMRKTCDLPARLTAIMSSTFPRSTPAAVRSSSTILKVAVAVVVVVVVVEAVALT